MKKAVFLALVFTAAGLWAQRSAAPAKYALVIGNGAYTVKPWNNLPNPVNDANDMAAALRGLGFEVDLIQNGNLARMQSAVISLKQKLRSSGAAYGFFYYAGHGAQNSRDSGNYLIPVDADTPSLNLLPQRALPVQFVLDELEEAGNTLNMVVLDACRDVPDLTRGASRGLSVIGNIPRGSIVMYATAANKTAGDGEGRNGLFTSHLLRNLTAPGLSVSEIFIRTGADVSNATNGDQFPEMRLMFFETAYLAPPPANIQRSAPSPVQPARAPVTRPPESRPSMQAETPANLPGARITPAPTLNPRPAPVPAAPPAAPPAQPASDPQNAPPKLSGEAVNHLERGIIMIASGDDEYAIQEFDAVIRLEPANAPADAYYWRGYLYIYRKGNADKAIADFNEAVRRGFNDTHSFAKEADLYFHRAYAYYLIFDYDKAIADYETVLRLDPANANAKSRLEETRREQSGRRQNHAR